MHLYGEGMFAMSAVKEIKVTQQFLGLPQVKPNLHFIDFIIICSMQDTMNCQNMKTFEDCTTKTHIKALEEDCGCIPFNLQRNHKKNVMK